MKISVEEFITRNQLHIAEVPIEVACFLPPVYKLCEIRHVILKSIRGQENFALPLGEKDLSLTLPILWNFACDGGEGNYLKWRKKNRARANTHGNSARTYYAYCRDIYLRMQKLLGDKEFEVFMKIPDECL